MGGRCERRGCGKCPAPLDVGTGAAVCRRGHVMEEAVLESEEYGGPCPRCGSGVITGCPACGRGLGAAAEAPPSCPRCAAPFPWSAGARGARRRRALEILGGAAACATILAAALYIGTFLG